MMSAELGLELPVAIPLAESRPNDMGAFEVGGVIVRALTDFYSISREDITSEEIYLTIETVTHNRSASLHRKETEMGFNVSSPMVPILYSVKEVDIIQEALIAQCLRPIREDDKNGSLRPISLEASLALSHFECEISDISRHNADFQVSNPHPGLQFDASNFPFPWTSEELELLKEFSRVPTMSNEAFMMWRDKNPDINMHIDTASALVTDQSLSTAEQANSVASNLNADPDSDEPDVVETINLCGNIETCNTPANDVHRVLRLHSIRADRRQEATKASESKSDSPDTDSDPQANMQEKRQPRRLGKVVNFIRRILPPIQMAGNQIVTGTGYHERSDLVGQYRNQYLYRQMR